VLADPSLPSSDALGNASDKKGADIISKEDFCNCILKIVDF